ncbi:MAG TPA: hypothetical protein VFG50_00250 [Rhodothermales bacterium]|nr:hypothetical protein [Rhodothermales bacterium]
MANIPVEPRHERSRWWLWLVGLIIIGALAWIIGSLFDPMQPVDDAAEGAAQELTPAPGAAPIITDPAVLFASTDSSLIGRTVQLTGMRVEQKLSDSVFTASHGAGRSILVVQHPNIPVGPGSINSGVTVRQGDVISIYGHLETMRNAMREAPGADLQRAGPAAALPFYLYANRIDVTDRS